MQGTFACMPSLIHYPCKGDSIERETVPMHPITPTHYPQVGKLLREGDKDEHLCQCLHPGGNGSRSRSRNRGTGSGNGRGWINGGRGLDPCHHILSTGFQNCQ